ncbi:MAG: glycosyltransferase involved in cell wall biosynthesis [Octadecabacter sp.]
MSVRYFFDVTDIKQYLKLHTTVSGIQRVLITVIWECVHRVGSDQVFLCIWDGQHKTYTALSSSFFSEMNGIDVDVLNAALQGRAVQSTATVSPVLARYRNRPVKYQVYRAIANFQALRGKESHFAKRGSSIAEWRQNRVSVQNIAPPSFKTCDVADTIQIGDQLVVLGATWGLNGFDQYLQHLKETQNVRITMQVHDLIPLVMPHHLASEFSLEFHRWLEASTRYCSRYFVAAQNTRCDLERFMEEVDARRPVTVIPFARKLGTKKIAPAPTTLKALTQALQHIRQDILNKTKVPYVLVVGTMESRKNLWRLVQAWDRLTCDTALEMPKLMFAGRQGWFNDDMMVWMRASGNLRGWVHFVDSPSDEELAYLYQNCLFTATVSLYEGWGLPIGESLGFGKTAVVADNSAMPEVGGDLVEYCDAQSITSITNACRKLIVDPDHRRALEDKIANTELRGWDDVVTDYIAALLEDKD